jgi:valyl-tRNA synthetase
VKPQLNDEAPDASAKNGLLLERIADVLRLLHPFVPFITEYLWQQIPSRIRPSQDLIVAAYPLRDDQRIDDAAETEFAILVELITKIRQIRSEMNIEPSKKIHVLVKSPEHRKLLEAHVQQLQVLTRSERLEFVDEFASNLPLAKGVLSYGEVGINLAGVLDLHVERERLRKELKKIETDLAQAEKKLSNDNFMKNAPPQVIEEQRMKFEDLSGRKQRTEEHLESLGSS